MAFIQFLMDRMFRPFFVGRMANNAPSRRVVSGARAKPGFQLVNTIIANTSYSVTALQHYRVWRQGWDSLGYWAGLSVSSFFCVISSLVGLPWAFYPLSGDPSLVHVCNIFVAPSSGWAQRMKIHLHLVDRYQTDSPSPPVWGHRLCLLDQLL